MALKAQEISSIIQKEIESFGQPVRTVNVGTVVEIGDGIARVHGLSNVMSSELVEIDVDHEGERGSVMGMALNLEEETVGVDRPRPLHRNRRGRHSAHHRAHRRGAGGRALLGRVVNAPGPADRRQGCPARQHQAPPGGAHRARRDLPPERGHAGADRHQGH